MIAPGLEMSTRALKTGDVRTPIIVTMDPTAKDTDPTGSPQRPPRNVFVVAAAAAFLVPWATQFGGPGWWSTTLVFIGVWVLIGASGVALMNAGGRVHSSGRALLAGDALGALLFLVTYLVVGLSTYGNCETCG